MDQVDPMDVQEAGDGGNVNTKAGLPLGITAFPPPPHIVNILDGEGNVFVAAARSKADDYRDAVRSLRLGEIDSDKDESDDEKETGAAAGSKKGETSKDSDEIEKEEEHALTPCLKFLGMAQAELNQLINVIDLVKAGEFMALERISGGMGAAAALANADPAQEKLVLAASVGSKMQQLERVGASLRGRAAHMREMLAVQKRFQTGIGALRKDWRVIAPRHGKVSMPLAAGEPLSVYCGTGPAAELKGEVKGRWLVPLACGTDGKVILPLGDSTSSLRTFEVEVRSLHTGEKRSAVSKPYKNDSYISSGLEEIPGITKYLRAVQHSARCVDAFDIIKKEALSNSSPWIPAQGAGAERSQNSTTLELNSMRGVEKGGYGLKTANSNIRSLTVSHILDDEVVLWIGDSHILVIRLIPWPSGTGDAPAASTSTSTAESSQESSSAADVAHSNGSMKTEKSSQLQHEDLVRASRLALHELQVLLQQQPDTSAAIEKQGPVGDSKVTRAVSPARAVPSGAGQSDLLKSLVQVVQHYFFIHQVCNVMRELSALLSAPHLCIPLSYHWTHCHISHTQSTSPSRIVISIGSGLRFAVSISAEGVATFHSLPGGGNVDVGEPLGSLHLRKLTVYSPEEVGRVIIREVYRRVLTTLGCMCSCFCRTGSVPISVNTSAGSRIRVAAVHSEIDLPMNRVEVRSLTACPMAVTTGNAPAAGLQAGKLVVSVNFDNNVLQDSGAAGVEESKGEEHKESSENSRRGPRRRSSSPCVVLPTIICTAQGSTLIETLRRISPPGVISAGGGGQVVEVEVDWELLGGIGVIEKFSRLFGAAFSSSTHFTNDLI